MLNPTRGPAHGRAWLLTTESRKALDIHARATAPSKTGLSFYAPDFALLEPEPWLLGEEIEFVEENRLPLPELVHKAEPSSADFQNTIEDILARIQRGEFQKVVPMVCDELEFAADLNRRMFRIAPAENQYSYGFEWGREGLAGVTPEVLFRVENGILSTMALAGTGRADGPSLLDDAKEMHEHRLVIDHICSELSESGTVERGDTAERVYGSLKHLHTPIRVRLRRAPDFMHFVARLHPTAALGGWPRKPAVEWLEQQPFHTARRRFGAPFGYVDGERMLCVVAIRGVQWCGPALKISAGCGIVAESEVLREWRELEMKRQSIYRLLEVNV